jgi:hypothetical protein
MAEQAHEFHHGDQDISAQVATFRSVMGATKWSCLAVAVGVLFFTLWFCTTAGFLTALISAIVLTVVGIVALHSRSPSH